METDDTIEAGDWTKISKKLDEIYDKAIEKWRETGVEPSKPPITRVKDLPLASREAP